MIALLHQISSGLIAGGIYASLALALVVIYQGTHHINFAQGEMAMFSTYLAWSLIQGGVPYWGAFVITVVVSFAIGILIERFIVRPAGSSSVLATVGVFVGLLIIINSIAGWLWDYTMRPFPSPFAEWSFLGTPFFSAHEAGAALVTALMLLLVWAFFRFTRLGLAMRAAAYNPTSSKLLGIGTEGMLALGWGLAASIGAVTGLMVAPSLYLDPNMMSGVLIYAFAGALLGGIANPWGAVMGSLIVGVLENLLGAYLIGTQLKLSFALVIIAGVLLLRPAGIFGKTITSRV
jgi:branched-chain amino acid transport system permease protein